MMDPATIPTKIGRNEPCPCGSGKKFKRCEHFTDNREAQHALLGMKLARQGAEAREERKKE